MFAIGCMFYYLLKGHLFHQHASEPFYQTKNDGPYPWIHAN